MIFGAGDREQQIVLSVEDDVTPESSQLYVIRLQPITATGGSRAEGILEGHLVIEDSDQAHGVVQLTRDEGQTLSTVRGNYISSFLTMTLFSSHIVQFTNLCCLFT